MSLNCLPTQLNPATGRYYAHRRDIFTLYDDGVLLTDDAWFGVTPEPVAL